MAALINLREEQSDRDIPCNFAFHTRQLARFWIDPHKPANLRKDRRSSRSGLIRGIRLHAVFVKHSACARFRGYKGVEESRPRGINQIVAFLLLFGDFIVGVMLSV